MSIADPWNDVPKGYVPLCNEDETTSSAYTLTVKDERRCLQEIRNLGRNMPLTHCLWNGMKAVDFALKFILNHQLKRKTKTQCGN